jgi:hypothetical protein
MKKRPYIAEMVQETILPKMFQVKQLFPRQKIEVEDIPIVIEALLQDKKFSDRIQPNMRIAITAGSRGIANVALTTKCLVDFVKKRDAIPFVIPAMGSHGGATAEGQREVIESYGITEAYLGCPIFSSMEVKKIGTNEEGMDVYIDKYAAESDGIILGCRIKPHTAFRGSYESGMMKMMTIGLGKQEGAEVCHEAGFKNMAKYVPMFGSVIIENAPILFALPTIENAFDETCEIHAIEAEDIEKMEPELLKVAYQNMPSIRVDSCDVLVVDQIGKNFSGDGMDPNITGTFGTPYATGGIDAQRVCVLDLSPETHGNGIGVGFADATTQRVFDKLELSSMYSNAITCTLMDGVRIPIIMESDRETIQVCIKTCNEIDKQNVRMVRIPNSLHVEHILLSEAYYDEAMKNPNLVVESELKEFEFDEKGNLF